MEVYISINGVLRNFIQKFDYHYNYHFLESDVVEESSDDPIFDYRIIFPIQNDNLLNHFIFQSKEEYENFSFIEFPLEIFGYSGVSYPTAMSDLNKLIYTNSGVTFTIIGIDELGKAKPSTLFFLSKNTFLGNNIKFISSNDIDKEWEKCDLWVTDNKEIIDKCPPNKKAVKFVTDYNQHFTSEIEINNLINIESLCTKFLEETTTSMSTQS